MRLLMPEESLKQMEVMYQNLNNEKASILIVRELSHEFYEIKSFEEIPSNAQLDSNENVIRIDPRFIKFIFRRSIEEDIGLILVHNHPNIDYSRFSESDLSLERTYYEFYKDLGGKNIFGSMVINNMSIDIRLIKNNKIILTENIEIILGSTMKKQKGYILFNMLM